MKTSSILADFAKGAAAGLLATWVMGKVTTAVYALESQPVKEREQEGWQDGKPAFVNAARKAAGAVGVELTEDQETRAGSLAHWGLGVMAGGLYAVVRRRLAGADAAQGLVFGLTFFLLVDEAMNWALGFSKRPTAFPWQAHARGLVGHLAYGATAETALDAFGRVA